MNWKQYEQPCSDWWNKKFPNDHACVTSKGRYGEDGGIDLVIQTPYGTKYGQCKHNFKEYLKVGVVRELKGVMSVDDVKSGIIFTQTPFSKKALAFAKKANIRIKYLPA